MSYCQLRKLVYIWILFYVAGSLSAQRWTPEDDFKHIKTFDTVLNKTVSELSQIRPIEKDNIQYFTNKQYDQIERLYFRYNLCMRSLFDIINAYKDFSSESKYKKNNVQAFILGYCATLTVYKYSAELVLSTSNNQLLIDKLNEEYPRTEIKGQGIDFIISTITNPDYLNNLDIANEFYQRELKKNNNLNNSSEFSTFIDDLLSMTTKLSLVYERHRKTILDNYTILPLEAADLMQVTTIEETVNDMINTAGSQLKAIQEFLFTLTADVRMPLVEGIKLTRRQKRSFKRSLKPGDIILTFSSGYLSNLILPGYFKHVLTYTGEQSTKNKYIKDIRLKPEQQNLIKSDHDIIEANSDGVRTTYIENYLNGYADRIIVFRPILSDNQIDSVMKNMYSFIGMDYDFDFDLDNGEKQTCSEIIYRSYNGIGNIRLDLEDIFGVTTLSGDYLLQYFINDPNTELISLLIEHETKAGKAVFLNDKNARLYLKEKVPEIVSVRN